MTDSDLKQTEQSKTAKVVCHMGRLHLVFAGLFLATQGDPCRDPDIPSGYTMHIYPSPIWEKEGLEFAANRINEVLNAV